MNGERRDQWVALTGHFLRGLFRLSFLDDAGEESFKRAMIGLLAGILSFGIVFARVYARKYLELFQQPTPDAYRFMLPADQLLLIVLPMFVAALVMSLILPSLFPDATDFQVLMALPVSRRSVFSAKVVALCLFALIFIGTSSVALGVPFSLLSSGRWAEATLGARMSAQIATDVAASLCTMAALAAIQGLVIILSPRPWLRMVSLITQTTLICVLVLSMPIIAQIPSLWSSLSQHPGWLLFAPPAWFLGVEEWLLGSADPFARQLALAALVGTGVVGAVAVACYLTVYRSFDRLSLTAASGRPPSPSNVRITWPMSVDSAQDAVHLLISATLRRSALHQLVACGMLTAGAAMSVNSIMLSMGLRERWVLQAGAAAPLTMVIAAVIGLRASFLIPTNSRAAWIFRLTEEAASRPFQLNAVTRTLFVLGVAGTAALAMPLQAAVLGLRASLAGLPIVLLLGWLLVEFVVIDWRRVPFTCTVLLGKRPAAYTLVLAFLAFNVFGFVGTNLVQLAISGTISFVMTSVVLLLIGLSLRWHRLVSWGQLPLEFEDYRPDAFDVLNLR